VKLDRDFYFENGGLFTTTFAHCIFVYIHCSIAPKTLRWVLFIPTWKQINKSIFITASGWGGNVNVTCCVVRPHLRKHLRIDTLMMFTSQMNENLSVT